VKILICTAAAAAAFTTSYQPIWEDMREYFSLSGSDHWLRRESVCVFNSKNC